MIRTFTNRIGYLLSARGPKLLKDLASLMTGQAATMVLGFVAFSFLARRLTTEQYGTVEFVVSIAAFAALVIEGGAGMIGVREVTRTPEKAPQIAAAVVLARLAVAAFVIPLVIVCAFLIELSAELRVLLVLYGCSLLFWPLKQEWLLQVKEHMKLAAMAQPIRAAVFVLCVLWLVRTPDDVVRVAWAEIAAMSAMSAFYIATQFIWTVPFEWRGAAYRLGYYIREGLAIGLSNMLWAFMLYAPMFLLVALGSNPDDTAWLGAAQRLVVAMVTMSFLYHFNIYPVVTRTVLKDRETWTNVTRSSVRLVAWGGCGIALGVALLGSPIMAAIFGAPFAAAGPVLAVLVWIFPLRFLTGHARWSLIADGQQAWLLRAEIVGSSVLIAVAAALIPYVHAIGAAIALLTGIAVSGTMTQYRSGASIGKMNLVRNAGPAFAVALAAYWVSHAASDDAVMRTCAGMGIFLLAVLVQARRLYGDLRRIAHAKSDLTVSDSGRN